MWNGRWSRVAARLVLLPLLAALVGCPPAVVVVDTPKAPAAVDTAAATGSTEPAPAPTVVDLSRAKLESPGGIPGSRVLIANVPTKDLTVTVESEGKPARDVTWAAEGTDKISIVVPLGPGGKDWSGEVTLFVAAGGSKSPPLKLRIDPLPAAPQAAKKTLERLQRIVLAGGGTTVTQLLGDPAALPVEARPLALAQHILDDPANPNSLARLLDGTAPALGGKPLDADLIDRVFSSSGLLDAVTSLQVKLDAAPPAGFQTQATGAGVVSCARALFQDVMQPPVAYLKLDCYRWARQVKDSEYKKILDTAMNAADALKGLLLISGGTLAHVVGPPLAIISGTYLVGKLSFDVYLGSLPADVSRPIVADVGPLSLLAGSSDTLTWGKVNTYLASKGYTVNVFDTLQVLLELVGIGNDLLVGRSTVEIVTEILQILNIGVDFVTKTLSGWTVTGDLFTIGAREWGPIDMRDYARGTSANPIFLRQIPYSNTFQPLLPGKTTFSLEVTLPLVGQPNPKLTYPVEVVSTWGSLTQVQKVLPIGFTPIGPVKTTGGTFRIRVTAVDKADQPVLQGITTSSFILKNVLATKTANPSTTVPGSGNVSQITVNSSSAGKPLAAGLAIDSSGSMSDSDPQRYRVAAAKEFVNRMNGSTDTAMIYSFGATSNPAGELLQDWTSSKAALLTAIDQVTAAGGTPLYNTLEAMVPLVAAKPAANFSRAIIALTDGYDNSGGAAPQSLIDDAILAKIPIYTVGLTTTGSNAYITNLQDLASKTGGAFAYGNDSVTLNNIYASFGTALKGSIDVTVNLTFGGGLEVGQEYELTALLRTNTLVGSKDTQVKTLVTVQ